jgi:hypothetical protein
MERSVFKWDDAVQHKEDDFVLAVLGRGADAGALLVLCCVLLVGVLTFKADRGRRRLGTDFAFERLDVFFVGCISPCPIDLLLMFALIQARRDISARSAMS